LKRQFDTGFVYRTAPSTARTVALMYAVGAFQR